MKTLKSQTIKLALVALTIVTGFASCKKDNGASPSVAGSAFALGIRADNSLATASASGLSTNASTASSSSSAIINWTDGIANVTKFELETEKGGVKKEIETKGLTNIDLFASTTSFANTTVEPGTYDKIEVKLVFSKTTSATTPLNVKGTFTKADGSAVNVELVINDDFEVKAEAKNVVVDNTTNVKTTVKLHLNQLFSGITAADLTNATVTSGTIVISSTSNAGLLAKVKLNVGHMGETEIEDGHHQGSDDNHSDDH